MVLVPGGTWWAWSWFCKCQKKRGPQRLPVMVVSLVHGCAASVDLEDHRSTHDVGASAQLKNVVQYLPIVKNEIMFWVCVTCLYTYH